VPSLGNLIAVLPGLQFTDFHKFLVSAGGLALAAGLALPIFLLRTQKTVAVSTKQLAELSEPARQATGVQQEQLLWLIQAWPWVSGFLVLTGVLLTAFGAAKWHKRQVVLNQKEQEEIKKIIAEQEKAKQESIAIARGNIETPKESEIALEEKIAESVPALTDATSDDLAESPGAIIAPAESPTTPAERFEEESEALNRLVSELPQLPETMRNGIKTLTAQELVGFLLKKSLPKGSEILRFVKLENGGRTDFLLFPTEPDIPELAIDVRFVSNPYTVEFVSREARAWATKIADATTGRPVYPVSVIVFDGDEISRKLMSAVTARFMNPTLPHAALYIFSFAALARAQHFPIDVSTIVKTSGVYTQY
jgi:hypothetical protein